MTAASVVAACESCAEAAWGPAWADEADRLAEELTVLRESLLRFQPLLARGDLTPAVDKAALEPLRAHRAVCELLVEAQAECGAPEVTP